MKIFKYFVMGCVTLSLFNSCDLDLYPYDAIETSQSFNSVSDAKNWSMRIHSDLRGRVYGLFTMATDRQADQLNATADYGNNYGAVHRWTDLLSDNYEIRDYYQGYYSALNNVNVAIQGFGTIKPANDTEANELKQYLGTVHFARAYYYFQLNIRFGKAFNATTSSTDLSVPLVLVSNLNATPARNTVKEVYDQILADIAIAKQNLATKAGVVNSRDINIDAVTALEARVKLFMNDWAGAKAAAESLIVPDKYKLYTTAAGLKDMWYNDAGNEVIFSPFVSLNETTNTNTGYIGWNAGNSTYVPNFLPSQWVVDTYSSSDFRKDVYFLNVTNAILQNGQKYSGYIVNKYPGNPALRASTTAVTNYLHFPKVFRIAEMYLISAEAGYRAGDAASAVLTRLNTLRTARGLAALSGVSGEALLTEVKQERFRELAFEGLRLEDLKRWGEGFTRHNPQNVAMLQVGADFTTKSVAASDNKFVWGIPDRDVIANPNIVQNPGW